MNDLISRQAALDMIDAIFPVDPTKSEYAQGIACGAALAKTYVEQLPSAQPESRREWYMKGYRDAQAVSCTDLCVDCPLFDREKHNCPRFNRVIPRAIEEVKPRWIPCEERLPDELGDIVVISTKGGKVREATYALCSGEQAFVTKDCWYCHGEVVAWMPLPEPYKGE